MMVDKAPLNSHSRKKMLIIFQVANKLVEVEKILMEKFSNGTICLHYKLSTSLL